MKTIFFFVIRQERGTWPQFELRGVLVLRLCEPSGIHAEKNRMFLESAAVFEICLAFTVFSCLQRRGTEEEATHSHSMSWGKLLALVFLLLLLFCCQTNTIASIFVNIESRRRGS